MGSISSNEIETIRLLEESLWRPETRFNPAFMERVLAAEFLELGRSGRVYSRAEILAAPYMPIRCTLPLKNFTIHPLADTVVLTIYISEVLEEAWLFANRSSIWIKSPRGWQIRFHQGTPFIKR